MANKARKTEHVPNAETRAAMREAERGGLPRFKSVAALLADLNADDRGRRRSLARRTADAAAIDHELLTWLLFDPRPWPIEALRSAAKTSESILGFRLTRPRLDASLDRLRRTGDVKRVRASSRRSFLPGPYYEATCTPTALFREARSEARLRDAEATAWAEGKLLCRGASLDQRRRVRAFRAALDVEAWEEEGEWTARVRGLRAVYGVGRTRRAAESDVWDAVQEWMRHDGVGVDDLQIQRRGEPRGVPFPQALRAWGLSLRGGRVVRADLHPRGASAPRKP